MITHDNPWIISFLSVCKIQQNLKNGRVEQSCQMVRALSDRHLDTLINTERPLKITLENAILKITLENTILKITSENAILYWLASASPSCNSTSLRCSRSCLFPTNSTCLQMKSESCSSNVNALYWLVKEKVVRESETISKQMKDNIGCFQNLISAWVFVTGITHCGYRG